MSGYARDRLTAEQALDALYQVVDDNYLSWLDELMVKAGFRSESGNMRSIPQPASGLIPALAAAIYERSDDWWSLDEVEDVIEDYGEDALWEGQIGPMLDEVADNLAAHRTGYRRRNR